eukprot:335739-Chlamydomonas_euryale.AAC.5
MRANRDGSGTLHGVRRGFGRSRMGCPASPRRIHRGKRCPSSELAAGLTGGLHDGVVSQLAALTSALGVPRSGISSSHGEEEEAAGQAAVVLLLREDLPRRGAVGAAPAVQTLQVPGVPEEAQHSAGEDAMRGPWRRPPRLRQVSGRRRACRRGPPSALVPAVCFALLSPTNRARAHRHTYVQGLWTHCNQVHKISITE